MAVPRPHVLVKKKGAWYPLFAHAWLHRFSMELGNYCCTSPPYYECNVVWLNLARLAPIVMISYTVAVENDW